MLLSLTTAGSNFLRGQEHSDRQSTVTEKEVLSVEMLKNDAMQRGDTNILEQIYGDNLIFVNTKGKLLTKQERVEEFASGNVKYASFRQGDYRVQLYGSTAIVTGVSCSVVNYRGKTNQTPRRFTSVYVSQGGQWRFVAHQATPVGDEESRSIEFCSN